jgi:hypothetical protein
MVSVFSCDAQLCRCRYPPVGWVDLARVQTLPGKFNEEEEQFLRRETARRCKDAIMHRLWDLR